tara:strand:+ start:108 stop:695 length:588 start_codon:yes stop_codon:yes gene_type:complete
MAVDPNNWKPQFNEREEQSTITPVPQTDGSIRYFLGNYDLLGTIDRIGMDEAGKYKKGVTPRAQIVDANGDDVDHAGAVFRVIMKNESVLRVLLPEGHIGSGFSEETPLFLEFRTENAADTYRPAKARVILNSGQWVEMTASEVDEHNKRQASAHAAAVRESKPGIQNVLAGRADERGLGNDTITRDSIKGLPTL